MRLFKINNNILRLCIGGRQDTILILAILIFSILFNHVYLPIGLEHYILSIAHYEVPLYAGYFNLSLLIVFSATATLTYKIIKGNSSAKPFPSNLDFISSEIPEQDKIEMQTKRA